MSHPVTSAWVHYWVAGSQAVVLAYFLTLTAVYLALLVLSWRWCREYKKKVQTQPIDFDALERLRRLVPPVTIIVPAFNEEKVIVESVRSLLGTAYANLEIVIVNDGSTDGTLTQLIRSFSLRKSEVRPGAELRTERVHDFYVSTIEPRLVVIDKENGGKADAQNAGINFCHTPYFLVTDADSLLEPEALAHALRAILEDPERIVAVGGIVRGVNGSIVDGGRVRRPYLQMNFWVVIQVIEYLRSFLAGRAGWSQINGLLVVPGAFGLFQKAACIKAGGFSTQTVTEDLEMVLRLHRYARERRLDWRMVFAPDAVCWTQMPTTARVLSWQRIRWHEGLWQSLRIHWKMCFNPRYGVVGMLSLPHQVLHEIGGPFVELGGVILIPLFFFMGLINARVFVLYLALAFFVGALFSLMAVLLDQTTFPRHRFPHDAVLLLIFSMLEYFGYRQLFLGWRLVASWNFFFGRIRWRASARTGFTTKAG
jgi:cellulose synthase/poly-beta-1,6-N-acetylglucosamine synthase-like glycosyltransferase